MKCWYKEGELDWPGEWFQGNVYTGAFGQEVYLEKVDDDTVRIFRPEFHIDSLQKGMAISGYSPYRGGKNDKLLYTPATYSISFSKPKPKPVAN